jgi:hypothetical protein
VEFVNYKINMRVKKPDAPPPANAPLDATQLAIL